MMENFIIFLRTKPLKTPCLRDCQNTVLVKSPEHFFKKK
jgi:hypothetical protein